MEELYKRPDRAAIAARVLAEQAALAERNGSDCIDPGEPVPVPMPPVRRCRGCGYLANTIGHWWACHG